MEVGLLLADFWLFLYFYIFPHIFGDYGPIFKIFVVKNIKINFPVVSKNIHGDWTAL